MTMYGANPDDLAALGRVLRAQIERVNEMIAAVDGPLGATTWQGPAKERFVEEWQGDFKSALAKLNEAFGAAGDDCLRRADGLRQVMGVA